MVDEIDAVQSHYLQAVKDLIAYQTGLMNEAGDETQTLAHGATIQIIVLSILAIFAGIGVAVWIVRALMRELGGEPHYAAEMVQAIAVGDLSHRIQTRRGDTTSLLASLQVMQRGLQQLVGEISGMVSEASRGNFGHRLDLTSKQGFGEEIGANLNQLAETAESGLKDVTRVVEALAQGDVSQSITRAYPGLIGQARAGVNTTVAALRTMMDEINAMATAASNGDFSQRIALDDKRGFAREISESLNQLADTTQVGLEDVMRVSRALSEGDLTQTITHGYPGLFGHTKEGINTTVGNLQQMVLQIKEVTDAVSTAANEIAAGNQDLSQRTEAQAGSLEETTGSIEELTSAVRQTADNARRATQLANDASEVAAKGGRLVRASVQTMAAISASSNKISEIIGVIDSIAFQTNILALNAAVEAARAGEQGRGFAVVAAEVRSLAQRSADAAKEIKTLITDSVAEVEAGTGQVNEAGASMEAILSAIARVNDTIADISAAADEQSSGVAQINQAMLQMDDMTQQNASLVEQATSAAEALDEQAQQLAHAIARFRVAPHRSQLPAVRAVESLPAVIT